MADGDGPLSSRWEQEQREVMDKIHQQARATRRYVVTNQAVSEAKVLLSIETMHPSVRVRLAHERLVQAYKTLEGLQDA